jgi:hypothetical protein
MVATVISTPSLFPLNVKLQDDRYATGILSQDIQPLLCYKNQVKSDVVDHLFHRRSRLYSGHRVATFSKTTIGFPLFVKTITISSLFLHAQDSQLLESIHHEYRTIQLLESIGNGQQQLTQLPTRIFSKNQENQNQGGTNGNHVEAIHRGGRTPEGTNTYVSTQILSKQVEERYPGHY